MKKMVMNNIVLLSCGSFNPITNMHLRMFELAKDYFNRMPEHKVIKGIISPVSDYYETKKKLESSEHRCQMVRKSLVPLKNQENWIQLDDWESRQNRWLRTIDVFNHHFKQINDGMNEQINLKLLCGADLFETFNVPNLWLDEDIEEIVSKYGLVVVTRVGFDPFKTLESSGKSKILLKHKENIHIVNEKICNSISSTVIREAIKSGESIRYLVQDPVIEYIEANKLYQ